MYLLTHFKKKVVGLAKKHVVQTKRTSVEQDLGSRSYDSASNFPEVSGGETD